MSRKGWITLVFVLIGAVLIAHSAPLIDTITVLFIILISMISYTVGQMNDRLNRIEAELKKKTGVAYPESQGDVDGGFEGMVGKGRDAVLQTITELREHLDGKFEGAEDDRKSRSDNAEKDLKWRLDNLKIDLQNLEKALEYKIESSSCDPRETLAEMSNLLAALEPSFKKQEAAIARQTLEFGKRLRQMEVDLREIQADADDCWSTRASRYSIVAWGPALDSYPLEELKRAYERAVPTDRVRLLRKLQTQHTLPYELALLAMRDSNSEVREWFARCGDFSPWIRRKFQVQPTPDLAPSASNDCSKLEEAHIADADFSRELVQIVLNDPDPFIRTCLRENPSVFCGLSDQLWLKYFRGTDHIGRLALLRNSKVANGLVEKVFNLECSELEIDLNERIDLGLAFLSNVYRLHELKDQALLCEEHHPYNPSGPAPGLYDAETFLTAIWKHSSEWPRETGIPAAIYASLAAPAHVRSSVYASCGDTSLKFCILDSCGWLDQETVEIALHDKDEDLRGHASTISAKVIAKNRDVQKKWLESEEEPSVNE
jgi:hypothetical protein